MSQKSQLQVKIKPGVTVEDIRKHFPMFSRERGAQELVYLDSAATTQKPQAVIDAVSDFYINHNANIHRGIYRLAEEASELYEDARKTVAAFIGAEHPTSVIFVRNTTEGLNTIAHGWAEEHLKKGDEILISILEHHSNILPWRIVAKKTGAKLTVIPMTRDGVIDLKVFEEKLSKKTRLVSLAHVSNVLGTIQPIADIIRIAKSFGARVVIDGAQAVPHMPINVTALGVDAYAFSGHKVYGPTGIGVLYLAKDFQHELSPVNPGGGTVTEVTDTSFTWRKAPESFEGGTPNIAGAIGLASALRFVKAVGWEWIGEHESSLLQEGVKALSSLKDVTIMGGDYDREAHGPILAFTVKGVHPHDLASYLNEEGIAIRAGMHCAEPLHRALGIPATARASFALYNTLEEVKLFAAAVEKAIKTFS